MTSRDARFVGVYEELFRYVYAYCRRRTSADQLDDAVSDVFLAVWRRIEELPDGAEVLPWLYSVAYGVLSNQRRGSSRRRKLEQKLRAVGVETMVAPEDYVVTHHESQQVMRAVTRLRSSEQEILRLSIWEDLTNSEVATVLNISVDSAKQRLSRARKSLTREYNRLENRRLSPPAAEKGGAW